MFTQQSFVERNESDSTDPVNQDIRLYNSDSDEEEDDEDQGITDTFVMVENMFKKSRTSK